MSYTVFLKQTTETQMNFQKFRNIFLVVLFAKQSLIEASNLSFNITSRHNNELLRCISDTVEDYAGRNTVILLKHEFEQSELSNEIIEKLADPVMIITEDKIPEINKFFLLLPQKNFSYTYLMPTLAKEKLYIYLAIMPYPDFSEDSVITLFEEFWSVRITSVLVLLEYENGSIGLYTYKPFSKYQCWDRGRLKVLDVWDPQLGSMSKGKKFSFLFTNFHGCEIRCLGVHRPPDNIMIQQDDGSWTSDGVGGKVLEIVASKLNFKPVISVANNNISEKHGWYFTDGPGELISTALNTEQYDLAYGWFSEAEYGYEGVERTKKTSIDCFGWAVPYRAGPKPDSWSNYVREFEIPVWALIFTSVVSGTLTLYVIPEFMRDRTDRKFRNYQYSLLYTISTLIEQPHHEKIQASSLRLYISNWLYFGLVITTAYKAMLGSFMTIPLLGPEFTTNAEVVHSNLHVGGGQETLRLLNQISLRSTRTRELLKRYEVLKPINFEKVTRRIVVDRDYAVFGVKRFIYYYSLPEARRLKVRIPIRFIPGCLLRPHTTQFMVKKNSFLRNPINKILLRLVESGIIERWVMHLGRNVVLNVERIKGKRLRLSRCYAPFMLLIIGCLLSFGVLIAEIMTAKNRGQEKRRLFDKRKMRRKIHMEPDYLPPMFPYLP